MKNIFRNAGMLLTAMLIFIIISSQLMASTATITSEAGPSVYGLFDVYSLTLTVNSGGTNTTSMTRPITGVIWGIETNPGTTAPTDNYDLMFNDTEGGDIMGAAIQNRDTATTEFARPAAGDVPTVGLHTITSSGNTVLNATVKVIIYVKKIW